MTDLKMAMEWLKTGQYLVKHDEMSYSVRVTDFAEETDELRKVLLDALRKEPCEYCDGIEALDSSWPIPTEVEFAEQIIFVDGRYRIALPKATKTGGINYRFSEPIHNCPNCGRPLPPKPEWSE